MTDNITNRSGGVDFNAQQVNIGGDVAGRKVVMQATLSARGQVCAQGEVVAVQMPENLSIQPPLDSTTLEGDI